MQATRFNLIGAFFNQTLPSSIGGDAVRLWLVARGGAGWRAATYSIFVDRAIGLIALAIVIVASLPWSYQLIADPNGRSALLLVDFAALAGGLGFLILGRLQWPWLKRWWATHHIHACSVIANRVIFSRRRGPKVAALSLLVHVLAVVIAWCVVRSIAAPVLFEPGVPARPAGDADHHDADLDRRLGRPRSHHGSRLRLCRAAQPTKGVNVSLLFGAVSFIVGAFGGLVWIFSAEKAAKAIDAPIGRVPEDEIAALSMLYSLRRSTEDHLESMKISVVTASFNSEATIGFTIESFLKQNHPDKEMLVIDGASRDGTLKSSNPSAPTPSASSPSRTRAFMTP